MERSELIQMRVTPEEKNQIREDAKNNGFSSMSEYLLDLALNKEGARGLKERLLNLLEDPDVRKKIERT